MGGGDENLKIYLVWPNQKAELYFDLFDLVLYVYSKQLLSCWDGQLC